MSGNRMLLVLIVFLTAIPTVASANVGTPLMWAGAFHLAIGNLFIGLVEAWVLIRYWGAPGRRAIATMPLANYASAWCGYELLAWAQNGVLRDLTILNVKAALMAAVLLAFVLTLLIELPFVWFVMRRFSFGKAMRALLVVHVVSYTLLVGFYWWVSGTSMITNVKVVEVSGLRPGAGYSVYYLTPDGMAVMRDDFSGAAAVKIADVAAVERGDRLFARPGAGLKFDLCVWQDDAVEILVEGVGSAVGIDPRRSSQSSDRPAMIYFNFGEVVELGVDSEWEYRTGFWPVEGITGESPSGRRSFALELPIAQWAVRCAVLVEGDLLIFQLGKDQLCVLDPEERRICLLARGKSPVVVLD